jgi:hypothetical protein
MNAGSRIDIAWHGIPPEAEGSNGTGSVNGPYSVDPPPSTCWWIWVGGNDGNFSDGNNWRYEGESADGNWEPCPNSLYNT